MLPGFNPKKMESMMKQLGMSQEEINASKVIIEKPDGKIVIENPSVTKIKMQGQETFQVVGESHEDTEDSGGISEEDIKTVMEKTGKSESEARNALEKTGDLAEAIMELSS